MYQRLRKHFSATALILSVAALVLALAGGAIAANGGATTSKGKAGPRGKTGKTGKTGPQGPAGIAGTNGTNGTNGKDGAAGEKGKDGTNGTPGTAGNDGNSVEEVGTPGPADAECNHNGGVIYEVEGSGVENEVCNGEEGQPGPEGALGTAGTTLPAGATETGAWATMKGAGTEVATGLSFPIQLAEPITAAHIHVPGDVGFSTSCPGSADHPVASPGELCVYRGEAVSATAPQVWQTGGGAEGASVPGAILYWDLGSEGFATGSYAVTGCVTSVGAQFPCP